jgi:large subunit ribosomal protein L1
MAKASKRARAVFAKVDRNKAYPVSDALTLVKECATAKFDESIDVSVNLGVDAKKSDQLVRGSVVLPAGTGKTVRVAVFAQGAKAEDAKAAGADIVGFDDLAADVKAGNMNFDVVIATPDAMKVVGALGQILGPRGLMPNPKVGTVTMDVTTAVKNAKAGQVQYRTDKAGIIHCTIGRASFSVDSLKTNLSALIEALQKGQAGGVQGCVSEESVAVQHHGRRRPRRPGQPVGASIELWAAAPFAWLANGAAGCQRPQASART